LTFNVIKRDERREPFDLKKLQKWILWACDGNSINSDALLATLYNRLPNEDIRVDALYDLVLDIATRNISAIQPQWVDIARNLYLLHIHKAKHGTNCGVYPDYVKFVERQVRKGYYAPMNLTTAELKELGECIDPKRDLLFDYAALYLNNEKYCLGRELPQHSFMRTAIARFDNIEDIKREYHYLSTHLRVRATPEALLSGTKKPMINSCCLFRMEDSTESINETINDMTQYSRAAGGLAVDMSALRVQGAPIAGKPNASNGPIPFIQQLEKAVVAYNQGGGAKSRNGACAVTYAWWRSDVESLLPLKDIGGSEDNRARKLQYVVNLNDIFLERVRNNEMVTLFDPYEVPYLLEVDNEEFTKAYLKYEADSTHIPRTKKINARKLMYQMLKYRKETGNLYFVFIDTVNRYNISGKHIHCTNLCTEIMLPTAPKLHIKDTYTTDENGVTTVTKHFEPSTIGLCALTSINLVEYDKLDSKDRGLFIEHLCRGADNNVETQFYPVKDAQFTNKLYRPQGIGTTNYTAWLAGKQLKITDKQAIELTDKIYAEIRSYIYTASCKLARERGACKDFNYSLFVAGLQTLDGLSDKLLQDIEKYGLRFQYHTTIAPGSSSSKALGLTEGAEPIPQQFYVEDNKEILLPSLAYKLKENRQYYVNAFDVHNNRQLLELAATRQKYIDQSQSVTLYYTEAECKKASTLLDDVLYAHKLGIKSLYYMKTPKSSEVTCASCS
jgi:ribonucleoside-diphosphate reductase alpha chain